MTETQNRQSSSPFFFFPAALGVILAGFFLCAVFVNPVSFFFLALGLSVILLELLVLRRQLNKRSSEIDLQIQNLEEKRNLLETEIQEEESAIRSFEEKIVNYSQLKGLTERLGMCLSLEETVETLSQDMDRLFGKDERTIILYLFHSKTGELGISCSCKGQMRVNIKSKRGDIFDQWTVKTMQPLLVEDAKKDYRFDAEKIAAGEELRPIRSLISAPMMVGHNALGILRVDSPREDDFTTEDLRFLTTIGDVGAMAVENARLYEDVEELAVKDGLTGLYLRRYLLERLPEEFSRHLRRKGEAAFLMFDLDKFKDYNDKFGHMAGDIVLRAVGMLLAEFFKQPGALVCRYGGEEFAVFLPDCSKKKAAAWADEIREKIAAQTIILRREKTNISVSVGAAVFPGDATNVKELIYKADAALYKAKEQGRNRVCTA